MQLTEEVHLVGSGGVGLSDRYDCHVYLINGGSALALVDAGCGLGHTQILDNIQGEGLDPARITHILLTHAHADHAGGCAALKSAFPDARVCLSTREALFLTQGDERELGLTAARPLGIYPADYRLAPCAVDVALEGDEHLVVGNLTVTAIATPGHSRGSICYLLRGAQSTHLFSGDVVHFRGLISLLNCAGSSLADYRAHIPKLAGLDVDALLPGHLLFTVRDGQRHIDQAIEAFRGLGVPKCTF